MKKDIFKQADVQHTYDKEQKIYSVKVVLNNKPRILTLRVGNDFTEISLADEKGNLLEVLSEKDGRVFFDNYSK
jgi:hypothetical protein